MKSIKINTTTIPHPKSLSKARPDEYPFGRGEGLVAGKGGEDALSYASPLFFGEGPGVRPESAFEKLHQS